MPIEAKYYESLERGAVRCTLCPAECLIATGKTGICATRVNREGKLIAENYGEVVTVAVDPIEKKPLYHFHPGSSIVSTGPNGCNMACENCQNWTISQTTVRTTSLTPEELAGIASAEGSIGVAFTYTEPMIWFEYIMDVAPLLKERGLKTVLVSNGYINPEPLAELIPLADAVNIDLKSMRPDFYKKVCKAELSPVLKTIEAFVAAGTHIEITNLIIPELNDADDDFAKLAGHLAELDENIPLHLSRYHPDYRMNIRATPAETMERALELSSRYLNYVFVGNIHIPGSSDSCCPECRSPLIERRAFGSNILGLEEGRCKNCGHQTGIVH